MKYIQGLKILGLFLFKLPSIIVKTIKIISGEYQKPLPTSHLPYQGRLQQSEYPSVFRLFWSHKIDEALCIGHNGYNENEKAKLFVAAHKKQLHIFDLSGTIIKTLKLPANFFQIGCGWNLTYGTMLFGTSEHRMYIMDTYGNFFWKYFAWLGVNEAHWGDLDGDGNDEIIFSNRKTSGALVSLTSEGKPLWKIVDIHNVWGHTIIPQIADKQALVLATEVSGAIKIYNHAGQLLKTLRPKGLYYSTIRASVVGSPKQIQIAAIGSRGKTEHEVVVFELTGDVIWSTPIYTPASLMINQAFASEDLNGDGICEWVFFETPDDLIVVSPQGKKMATLTGQENIEEFIIVPQPDGYGILVTLQKGVVKAYKLDRS